MKTPLKLLPLLLLLALPAAVQAQYTDTTNNGTITITGYTGSGGAVTIPDTINGLPVTSIGSYAFQNWTSLTSVTIPNSVTSIGSRAFYYCTSLSSVTIPNSVTSIGDGAFSACGSLTSVTIPNSVTNIGSYTFSGSQSLTNVTIGSSVTSIGSSAFQSCTKLASVTIPNSVANIGNYAFYECYKLTSVTIPNTVTNIGIQAFYECISLTSVTIPNSVISMGSYAFQDCISLTNVTIGNGVTNIGSSAFYNCATLSAITVDTNNPAYSSVDGVLFNQSQTTLIQCPGGKAGTYTIPTSVTSLGDRAFDSCLSLTSVTIGNNVTNIGYYAFDHCSSLTTVTIGNSVTSIGSGTFQYCTSLAGVYFQGNAPSVGSQVFDYANNAIVYYLLGTTGWDLTFGGLLTSPILTIPAITITGSFPPGPVTNGSLVDFGGSVCNTGNITLTNIFVFSGQPSNTLVLGPITLAPGACAPFTGSYLAIGGCNPTTNLTIVPHSSVIITPTNTVTVTPTNSVIVTPTNTVTVTPTNSVIVTPTNSVIVTPTNTVTVTTTNIVVLTTTNTVTVTPTNIVVLTPTNTVTVTPTNTVTITPTNTVTITPTNTVTVTPTNTVTVTTNTVTPTFGTIDPLTGILTDRFNIPSNLHGLMFADQDENWGPTLFYSTRQPASGADTFDTISTVNAPAYAGSQYVGFVTNEYNLTLTGYDALTLAAPDVGYGSVNFYYLRHDNLGVAHFGEIIAQGASSDKDLPTPLADTGYTGLAFAAANVDNYGANMFYYVRNDTNGLSWFGTINPTPGLVATNLYTVGTNFDALVYVDLAPIPGWGTNFFAYLRHDNIGSIIGTIDPVTHVVTDRVNLGTNFLTGLTFTATDVGYGPNLFYYLRPERSTFTTNTVTTYTTNTVPGFITNTVPGFITNTVSDFITNTVSGFVTNTVSGFVTNTVSGFVTNTVPGFVTNTVSGFVTNTVSGFVTNTVSGFVTNMVSGFITNTVPGFVTNTVPGFVTNTVTTYTTNSVVSFTPTNTVTATGMDIYQVPVTAAANCGCVALAVAPPPLAPVIGTPTVVNGIFSLSFPTEKGNSYTVQYKNTFTDPWTNLPGMPVSGTGGDLTITDPTAAGQPSRFYRVTSP
jgi:hypothetical protein